MPTNPAISCGYLFQDCEKKTVYPQMDPMWDCFVFSMSTFKIFLEAHTLSLSLSLSLQVMNHLILSISPSLSEKGKEEGESLRGEEVRG